MMEIDSLDAGDSAAERDGVQLFAGSDAFCGHAVDECVVDHDGFPTQAAVGDGRVLVKASVVASQFKSRNKVEYDAQSANHSPEAQSNTLAQTVRQPADGIRRGQPQRDRKGQPRA